MKNLWQKTILCVAFCWGTTLAYSAVNQKTIMADELSTIKSQPTFFNNNNQETQALLLASGQKQFSCQSLGTNYQEHYNFETRNYNVSICRKHEDWFYYRESKSNPDSALLLPAQAVFGGDTFKAVDGKVTYFVGVNSEGYYSSVMYGDNQMIFEPQLSRNSELNKQRGVSNSVEMATSEIESSETLESDLNLNYWSICTEDQNDLHPYLNGWQKFIGKSPHTINEYATLKGHNFQESDTENQSIWVETTDGLMVTFSVVELTEMVNSVCVKPIASF